METKQISHKVWYIILFYIIPFFVGYSIGKLTQKDKVIIPPHTQTIIYHTVDGTSIFLEPGITIIGKR